MVSRLHGPDVVAVLREGFSRVGADAEVDDEGLSVAVQGEGAYVVMVVAVCIIAGFDGEGEVVVARDEEAGAFEVAVRRLDGFFFCPLP